MFQKCVSSESTSLLMTYLLNHESDIAWRANDFEDLRLIFIELIGHEPKKRADGDK